MTTKIKNDINAQAWVGCLGCYNSGTLRGSWVDALVAGDILAINEPGGIEAVIGDATIYGEDCPICKYCGSDEFWVMDHEGFNGLLEGECSPSTAQEIAERLQEMAESDNLEAAIAFVELGFDWDLNDFESAYIGEFNSDTELAEYFIDNGLSGIEIPDTMIAYFDYEMYGRDLSYDLQNFNSHYFWNL
jgi:antirestriction protein